MKKLVKFALAAALGSIFAATTVPANAAVTLRMGYDTLLYPTVSIRVLSI